MDDLAPFYPTLIPLAFFFWGPALVMLLFWLVGLWAGRLGVARALESDWDGFTRDDVEKLFTAYGEKKRALYRNRLLPADAAVALTYAIVGGVIVAGLSMRGYPWWVAALCGGGWLFGGLCDIAENLAVARLLDRYPAVEDGTVAFASGFTRIKLVLFLLGVIGAIAAAYLAFRPLAG
ncbi:hypothetical protein [Bosea sp. (in: a-proteobacteria)]|uniref:hypothetical protein n=1 Tax=Bosea sp. (in: a-proteobacteria) TaxID=1871050 RepID=UPI002FCB19FA